jgi:hypothetical protein
VCSIGRPKQWRWRSTKGSWHDPGIDQASSVRTGGGERDQGYSLVGWVSTSFDEPGLFEGDDEFGHRWLVTSSATARSVIRRRPVRSRVDSAVRLIPPPSSSYRPTEETVDGVTEAGVAGGSSSAHTVTIAKKYEPCMELLGRVASWQKRHRCRRPPVSRSSVPFRRLSDGNG